MLSGDGVFLGAVLSRCAGLAEDGVGCSEQSVVIVVAKAAEEVPRFAERSPANEPASKVGFRGTRRNEGLFRNSRPTCRRR